MPHDAAIQVLEEFLVALEDPKSLTAPPAFSVELGDAFRRELTNSLDHVSRMRWRTNVQVALVWLRSHPEGPKGLGHRAEKHAHCRQDMCMICDGGLFACVDCRLFEGSVTTECPRVNCYFPMSDVVYAGFIDFKDGQWVAGNGQMPCWAGSVKYDEDVVTDQRPMSTRVP
jgi:hypothetical protein